MFITNIRNNLLGYLYGKDGQHCLVHVRSLVQLDYTNSLRIFLRACDLMVTALLWNFAYQDSSVTLAIRDWWTRSESAWMRRPVRLQLPHGEHSFGLPPMNAGGWGHGWSEWQGIRNSFNTFLVKVIMFVVVVWIFCFVLTVVESFQN